MVVVPAIPFGLKDGPGIGQIHGNGPKHWLFFSSSNSDTVCVTPLIQRNVQGWIGHMHRKCPGSSSSSSSCSCCCSIIIPHDPAVIVVPVVLVLVLGLVTRNSMMIGVQNTDRDRHATIGETDDEIAILHQRPGKGNDIFVSTRMERFGKEVNSLVVVMIIMRMMTAIVALLLLLLLLIFVR